MLFLHPYKTNTYHIFMKLTEPLHFAPRLKSVIWGGDKIAAFKNLRTDIEHIGESWEVSAIPGHESVVDCGPLKGRRLTELTATYGAGLLGSETVRLFGPEFPLLVKIIDAAGNLSVQVHPDDALALRRHNSKGKTEMWHVIDTSPGARIFVGFNRALSPDEYRRMVADGTIMDAVAAYDSAPGDTYFIPAGRIHAIGAGNLLVEIQESSDITYRIFDYNRRDADGNPRELHTDLAADALDFSVLPGYRNKPLPETDRETVSLVRCPYFNVVRHEIDGDDLPLGNDSRSMMILTGLEGSAAITWPGGETRLNSGDTLLLPAAMAPVTARGHATFIAVTLA